MHEYLRRPRDPLPRVHPASIGDTTPGRRRAGPAVDYRRGEGGDVVNESGVRPMQRTVESLLIVGCGRLGMALGRLVIADGGEVVGLRRHVDDLPAAFRTVSADVTEPLAAPLPPVDSIVFTLPPNSGDIPVGGDVYERALTNVAAALSAPPRRVVFVSSTRVFEGVTGSATVDESTEPAPRSPRAESLLNGERLAARLFSARIIRPTGIYGDGRNALVRRVQSGDLLDGSRLTNRIHQDDLARGIHEILRSTHPPALVHATDDHPTPLRDVATFIARRLGVDPPPFSGAEGVSGRRMSGALFRSVVGALTYPDYQAGYAQVLRESR